MTNTIEKVEALIASYDNSPHQPKLDNDSVMEHLLEGLSSGYTRTNIQLALASSHYAARFAVAAAVANTVDVGSIDLNALERKEIDVVMFSYDGNKANRTPYNLAQAILNLMEELEDLVDLPTGFHSLQLSPEQLGQLMMERLPVPDDGLNSLMKTDECTYWMQVADYLGPDWIQSFRKVSAFMHKVEGF